mmetsp:Transcript_27777/g.45944  ORF Transcript_27777/g.45944 Transcript_27777/m.45944 type:complete len:195 (-) Transcript_27777:97-681(-)
MWNIFLNSEGQRLSMACTNMGVPNNNELEHDHHSHSDDSSVASAESISLASDDAESLVSVERTRKPLQSRVSFGRPTIHSARDEDNDGQESLVTIHTVDNYRLELTEEERKSVWYSPQDLASFAARRQQEEQNQSEQATLDSCVILSKSKGTAMKNHSRSKQKHSSRRQKKRSHRQNSPYSTLQTINSWSVLWK